MVMQLRPRKRPKSELTSIINTPAEKSKDAVEPKKKRRVKNPAWFGKPGKPGKPGKTRKPEEPEKPGNPRKPVRLLNMPMNILFEIFGCLEPIDILNLARMTKQFRRVLMHRSSLSVWKKARANVPGLPDCPPSVAEPRWANLAFDQHCNFCPALARRVEWRLQVRMCPKCAGTRLFKGSFGAFSDIDPDWHNLIYPGPIIYCEDLIPSLRSRRGQHVYLLDDHRTVKVQYLSIQGADDRQAFVKERRAIVRQIREHAVLCKRWANGLVQNHSQALRDKSKPRKQA